MRWLRRWLRREVTAVEAAVVLALYEDGSVDAYVTRGFRMTPDHVNNLHYWINRHKPMNVIPFRAPDGVA